MINELNQLKALLESPNRFIILAHKSPDGDAVGSAAAFFHFLSNISCDAQVVLPDLPSDTLLPFMADTKCLYFTENPGDVKTLFEESSVLICLDFNASSRVGEMHSLVDGFKGVKVMIDHHPEPEPFSDIMISDVTNSSTCQLIYECIELMQLTHAIDQHVARSLYLGIMTDTGSFRFPSTTASVHKIVAHLKELGLQHAKIHENIYDNSTEGRLKFMGNAFLNRMTVLPEFKTAVMAIPKSDIYKFELKTGDTEGLVNYLLSIEGIKFAAILIDREEERKWSFRSKGNFDVNIFARTHFEGGGHANAAGGRSSKSLDETLNDFKTIIENYKSQLTQLK